MAAQDGSDSSSTGPSKWRSTLGKSRGPGAGPSEPLLGATSAASGAQSAAGTGGDRGPAPPPREQNSQDLAADFVARLQPGKRGGSRGDANSGFYNALRQRSMAGHVDESRVQKFLIRLATALHAYGSSAARTEYLVEKAAERLEVDADIAVLPTLIMLSFGDGKEDSLSKQTILIPVTQDLDVDKLGRVDELARNVGQNKHEILVAYWQLRAIANAKPTFGLVYRLAAFTMMAAAAARLFFGGSLYDAAVAGLLGLAGGLIELWACASSPVAASVVEFLAAIFAAFVTRLIISFTRDDSVCFYPATLSSLVWFLPGLSLTLGVNELVAKTYVSGSSHIVAAIFSAFQLGFGIAFGANLVFWDPNALSPDCSQHVAPPALWAKAAWFVLYVLASNILLNARLDQWPGMVVVAFVGYAVSEATLTLGNEASSILSAFAISVSGTLGSRVWDQLPLAMKMSGILVLVPGGIGVSGVAALLQNNASGALFVFEMLMVALAITLGLLMGKIFFPEGLFGYTFRTGKLDKKRIAHALKEESFLENLREIGEEEAMAF